MAAILLRGAMIFAATTLLLSCIPAMGSLECEDLTPEECAFAVSSSGSRCVLEKSILPNGETMTDCQTSSIIAGRPEPWIESTECIKACGVERETYGLSTDALMEKGFADKVCSPECQNNCPNIIDIYFKLAAGEGVYLPRLCRESRARAQVTPHQVVGGSQSRTRSANDNYKVYGQSAGPWNSSLIAPSSPVVDGPASATTSKTTPVLSPLPAPERAEATSH